MRKPIHSPIPLATIVEHGSQVVPEAMTKRSPGFGHIARRVEGSRSNARGDLLELGEIVQPHGLAHPTCLFGESPRLRRRGEHPRGQLDRGLAGGIDGLREVQAITRRHVGGIPAREGLEAFALRGGLVRRRTDEERLELDVVAFEDLTQHLGGEMAVGIIDLMEVADAMGLAAKPPQPLGDPAPSGAGAGMGKRQGEEGGDAAGQLAHRVITSAMRRCAGRQGRSVRPVAAPIFLSGFQTREPPTDSALARSSTSLRAESFAFNEP